MKLPTRRLFCLLLSSLTATGFMVAGLTAAGCARKAQQTAPSAKTPAALPTPTADADVAAPPDSPDARRDASAESSAAAAGMGDSPAAPKHRQRNADADAPYTAADAGRDVVAFVTAINGGEVTLDEARADGPMFRVRYHGEGDKPKRRTAWVTADGRWVTAKRIDIETRIEHLRAYEKWAQCLRKGELRIFLDTTEATSKKQLRELGPVAKQLFIECSGKRRELCKNLGFTSFPSISWRGGAEVGLHKQQWISGKLGCDLTLFQEVAAPTEVDSRDLGRRVQTLHELAAGEPIELVSVRRNDAIYHVVLSKGTQRPQFIRLSVSSDGVHLLDAPIDMQVELRRVRDRRSFVDCLLKQQVRLFLDGGKKKHLRWLASIAPEARRIAVDCAHPKGRGVCKKAKITKLPTAMRGAMRISAPISLQDIEALSGCKR